MKGVIFFISCFTGAVLFASNVFGAWTNDGGELVCRSKPTLITQPIQSYSTKGGSDVWPWGNELSFPWTGIDGIWQTVGTDCGNLFSFSMLENSKGVKIVNVQEYDPVVCKVVSTGRGFESRRVVRAVMTGTKGNYQLTIHAFRTSEIRIMGMEATRQVLVLRVRPMNSNGRLSNKSYAYRLEKIDKSPSMMCKN